MELLSVKVSDIVTTNEYGKALRGIRLIKLYETTKQVFNSFFKTIFEQECSKDEDTVGTSEVSGFDLTGAASRSPHLLLNFKTGENSCSHSNLFKVWDSSKFNREGELKPEQASNLVLIEVFIISMEL